MYLMFNCNHMQLHNCCRNNDCVCQGVNLAMMGFTNLLHLCIEYSSVSKMILQFVKTTIYMYDDY